MATFIVSDGDILEATWISAYQNSTVLNVFHYQAHTVSPITNGEGALGEFINLFDALIVNPVVNPFKDLFVNSFVCHEYRAQIVHPFRRPYISSVAYPWAGMDADPGIPSDTNMTVSLRPLAVGRGLTGNKKFTGLQLSSISGDSFTNGMITDMGTAAIRLRDPVPSGLFAGLTWTPVIWSPRLPGSPKDVWATTARPEVRVLRRRQKGIGI